MDLVKPVQRGGGQGAGSIMLRGVVDMGVGGSVSRKAIFPLD